MDMVCEKTSESTHDFENDGLELYVEDGFLKAKDTTLGGDDGVAVAMALALLDSREIPHPPCLLYTSTACDLVMTAITISRITKIVLPVMEIRSADFSYFCFCLLYTSNTI